MASHLRGRGRGGVASHLGEGERERGRGRGGVASHLWERGRGEWLATCGGGGGGVASHLRGKRKRGSG